VRKYTRRLLTGKHVSKHTSWVDRSDIKKKTTNKYIGRDPFTDINLSDRKLRSSKIRIYNHNCLQGGAIIMKMLERCIAFPFLISCAFPFSPRLNVPSYYALFNYHGQVALLHRPATPFFHSEIRVVHGHLISSPESNPP